MVHWESGIEADDDSDSEYDIPSVKGSQQVLLRNM